MHKKHRILREIFSYLITTLMIVGFILGVIGPTEVTAQANTNKGVDVQESLEIKQGNLIHHYMVGGETHTFTLDVKSPEMGIHYFWDVVHPPVSGDVFVQSEGIKAQVTYQSEAIFNGDVSFDVLLTSSKGQETKITIFLTVESLSSPEPLRIQPVTTQSEGARESNPIISVTLGSSWIDGYSWPLNTEVTLSIGDNTWVAETNEGGWVWFNTDPFKVQPGQTVTMTDGVTTRTHVVADLAVTDIDEVADTLNGTADANQELSVYASDESNWETRNPTSDADGLWTADFSGSFDIAPRASGAVHQYDAEGNRTEVYWDVPNPNITVYLTWNEVSGTNWSPNTEVTLKIGNYIWKRNADKNGRCSFYLYPFELKAGQTVTMTDGIHTRTHVVADLAVTDINEVADTLSGKAGPNQALVVFADDDSNRDWKYPTADKDGQWTADFSGSVDIAPGASGWALQYDDEGNRTQVHWYVPNPKIIVNLTRNEVRGNDWSSNAEVTLSIKENTWSAISSSYGWVSFNLYPFEIRPGQTVTLTDGVHTRTHVVANLSVSEINKSADTISGTADANRALSVYASDGILWDWKDLTANDSGQWTADFSGSVDIAPGAYGQAYQYEADGDSTQVSWDIPNPNISVNLKQNFLYGNDWSPNAEVTLSIDGNTWTAQSSTYGWVSFYLYPFEINPGDKVTMTDGVYTRTHIVADLSVTAIDEIANTLSGTADPNQVVTVYTYSQNYYYYVEGIESTADAVGIWTVDFSGLVDIGPGSSGWVSQFDVDKNYTQISWFIPDPVLLVDVETNEVFGNGWNSEAEVTLTISDRQWKSTSSYFGHVYFDTAPFDILPDQTITMTDGQYTLTHQPWDIEITNIDIHNSTLSGTVQTTSVRAASTLPGYIEVQACGKTGCFTQQPTVDESGNWHADFSDTMNFGPGTSVYVTSEDGTPSKTTIRLTIYGSYLPIIIK